MQLTITWWATTRTRSPRCSRVDHLERGCAGAGSRRTSSRRRAGGSRTCRRARAARRVRVLRADAEAGQPVEDAELLLAQPLVDTHVSASARVDCARSAPSNAVGGLARAHVGRAEHDSGRSRGGSRRTSGPARAPAARPAARAACRCRARRCRSPAAPPPRLRRARRCRRSGRAARSRASAARAERQPA